MRLAINKLRFERSSSRAVEEATSNYCVSVRLTCDDVVARAGWLCMPIYFVKYGPGLPVFLKLDDDYRYFIITHDMLKRTVSLLALNNLSKCDQPMLTIQCNVLSLAQRDETNVFCVSRIRRRKIDQAFNRFKGNRALRDKDDELTKESVWMTRKVWSNFPTNSDEIRHPLHPIIDRHRGPTIGLTGRSYT